MSKPRRTSDTILWFLQERAKELNCLYKIEELLSHREVGLTELCKSIVEAIPAGWQFPDVCQAKITLEDGTYCSSDFKETQWVQSSDIKVQDAVVGKISVYYIQEMPRSEEGPFLEEEGKLLDTIASRFGHFILYKRMNRVFHGYNVARKEMSGSAAEEWRIALNLLRQTDKNLYLNISRRMLNQLCWRGIREAERLLVKYDTGGENREIDLINYENRPHQKNVINFSDELFDAIFSIAAGHLSDDQILSDIQKWVQEDRLSFLIRVVNRNLSLAEVTDAIRRYHLIAPSRVDLPPASKRGIQASLIRCFLSEQPQFINIAKEFIEITDFYDILDNIIYTADSHGKLGGKSAGLFLATQIIKKTRSSRIDLKDIKIPKTWYIASDVVLDFLSYNNLNEVVEQKYKNIDQVRLEYPHVVQTFKNGRFPPEIVHGLSVALDDFSENPLIVRSSSLLEDRIGAAFSGKYKSLFLANQGGKQERLEALMDAIAEVYASTFGPDPIEYRAERGLLDFSEEMGIIIQEVVGNRMGDYFLPAFAGVAFSRNEFRWSPRIKREDGLLRIVPGLGTRAVDRTSDDYPFLIAPGQRGLRINVTVEEVVRYSPKMVDVINLKTNVFETIMLDNLLKEVGEDIPGIEKIVSIFDGNCVRKPMGLNIDFEKDDIVVTFEGLIGDTDFIDRIDYLLNLLEERLKTPVDIEFASDGVDFYLLQCRPQSYTKSCTPSPIPKGIPRDRMLFTANRFISNGLVPDITHIVYVDPQNYDGLGDRATMVAVGRAVGSLNKLLPKKRFVLMGPGRWGSRGDIKLGVPVTYSDINNTAALIEIARKKGNWVPDLSFGTHFFQDLVEAEIRYLPLYPDDEGIIFNEEFFAHKDNILPKVLPEYANLSNVIRLIDVPGSTGGLQLRILMNADLEESVGILVEPSCEPQYIATHADYEERPMKNHWAWRLQMAEVIASQLDPHRFGAAGFYLFGSTKNGTAGLDSDINVIVHFQGTKEQRNDLMVWLEGWSLCLDEMNYIQTGHRTGGLLDIHLVTDDDIEKKTSYAIKIDAVTNAARSLPLGT